MKPPCHDNILSLCRITLGFDPVLAAVSPSTYLNKPDSTDLEWGMPVNYSYLQKRGIDLLFLYVILVQACYSLPRQKHDACSTIISLLFQVNQLVISHVSEKYT
jgi:hypothetical protein